MTEPKPLTKDKIFCTDDTSGCMDCNCHYSAIKVFELKSALEYLEQILEERYRDPELYQLIKKAFPALYEGDD